jgi:hypothetical protein
MSDWQPGRVRIAHQTVESEIYDDLTPKEQVETLTTVFLFRPFNPPDYLLQYYRDAGCDAMKFYETKDKRVACEHEILTD